MQCIADRLYLAEVGRQGRNAILIQRYRRRGRRAAGQRYRRHAREPLEFQAHHRVLADWGAVVHHGEGHHLARVVELERLYFSDLNAVEVYVAALVQAAGGTFENDAKRTALRDTMDFLEPEKTDKRRGDGRKRRGSNHQVARPRFHLKIRLRCTLPLPGCTGKANRAKGRRCQPAASSSVRIDARSRSLHSTAMRSLATESRIVRPSAFQSYEMSPPSWPFTVARASRAPKPSSPSPRWSTRGPPRSVHVKANLPSPSEQATSIWPVGVESAPYLAALVANSWRSKAKPVSEPPASPISGPLIVTCAPSSAVRPL